MKICYIGDASSVHVHKWANYFTDQGHDVMIISLSDGQCPGARIYSFQEEGFTTKTDVEKLISYIRYEKKIKKIILSEKPDIIHAHYGTSYGRIAAKLNIHPYILSVWGSDVYDFPKRSFFHEWLVRYNLKKADVLLSTSRDMKKVTRQYTDKEIMVTPFGVDTTIYKPLNRKKEKDSFTVGIIKALRENYGINHLIEAYDDFLQRSGEIKTKLLIGGKGDQEQELRNLVKKRGIENHVEFLGFLNQREVIENFNRMDVAVFPVGESFGVAAVEAQSCGCAVIVANGGGLPEATKENYSSILIRENSVEDIRDALLFLYDHPSILKQMKENARDFVLSHYKIEDNFNDVIRIYEQNKISWRK
ncbi:MAG: glycosyltransferase family 4 protein [Tissierellia bacterium]|nr:glycosyltransferase family 4 protein [Tissierellia bacterium]